jgi:protein arginine kinase activator
MEFRAEGRLGCPHDYAVFQRGLEPLLERIHRASRHRGKTPRRASRHADLQAELVRLRQQLRGAIEAEAYEEAARLRDLLRQKEAAYESG